MNWTPTVAGIVSGIAATVLFALGLGTGRADVAVLGVPLAGGLLWGSLISPRRAIRVERGAIERGAKGRISTTLELETPPGTDSVQVRLQAPGYRTTEFVLAPGRREIEVSIETVRTGRVQIFPLAAIATGAEGLTRGEPVTHPPLASTLLPRVRPLAEMPLPFRLQGLTGGHGSPRIGDGGDMRDVNVFTPGDRLRRIDWRVTARRAGSNGLGRIGELYVRRTFAVADATVVLVIDSRDEVGPDVSTWSEWTPPRHDQLTSLDVAREAALSVARQYLELGDRVGMEDLGGARAQIAPAGGRRQLQRLAQRLALAEPEGEPLRRVRAPHLPSGALVVLFSTFLDDQPVRMARQWRHGGHRVIAIDILPELVLDELSEIRRLAFEIIRLERADRLGDLRRADVDLIHWGQAGDAAMTAGPAMQLTVLARSGRRR